MPTAMNTLVMGASLKEDRYSNKAVRSLRRHGIPVMAVGLREGQVEDVHIAKDLPADAGVHTVTMYLNAHNQAPWEERILALWPKRIIFNPGAENEAFGRKAQAQGVEVLEACTLVLLSTGQF